MVFNVTLIFTRHKELGVCTSDALFQIIESINPEVIFEELSEALYEEAYSAKTLNNLESVAIRKYLTNHDVVHIPVDTYDRPKNYDRDQNHLYNKLTESVGIHSFHFRGLLDQQSSLISEYGFHFLNSSKNEKYFENMDALKEKILNTLNDENLYRIARLDKDVIEKREEVILDNVYNFSKKNTYNHALMFIGSGHRKSIMKKIEDRNKTENIKINWYSFSDLINVSQLTNELHHSTARKSL